MKSFFFEELQDCLDSVPQDDTLLILGDFNVHVGVRDDDDEQLWTHVLGNMALEYAIWLVKIYFNFVQLSVMNSFYTKKYYGTWTHPGTKI